MNVRPVVSQVARLGLFSSRRAAVLINVVRNSSAYKPPANWKPPHYDELPLPQGSWQTAHEIKQKKYNIHLIAGISLFVLTLTYVKASGILFFNFSPPPLPEGGFK